MKEVKTHYLSKWMSIPYLIGGLIVGAVQIGVGLILLPGFLFIVGLFLIISGIISPLLIPLLAMQQKLGLCPYCDNEISASFNKKVLTCKYCKNRIFVSEHSFRVID